MADVTKVVEEWKPPLEIVLALSRELLEIDQICHFQLCAPRLEE